MAGLMVVGTAVPIWRKEWDTEVEGHVRYVGAAPACACHDRWLEGLEAL
jgi:hypothetical protein